MAHANDMRKKLEDMGMYEAGMSEQDMDEIFQAVTASLNDSHSQKETVVGKMEVGDSKNRLKLPNGPPILKYVEKQRKELEEYRSKYHKLTDEYQSSTWIEVRERMAKEQPPFMSYESSDLSFDEKVAETCAFFNEQLKLIQAQQSLSGIRVPFGQPILDAEKVESRDETNNNNNNNNNELNHTTRSGRLTRKPMYFGAMKDEDDFDYQRRIKQKGKTNQEIIATSRLFADKVNTTSSTISNSTVSRVPSEKSVSNSNDGGKMEANGAVLATTSKHEAYSSALFDGLINAPIESKVQTNIQDSKDEILRPSSPSLTPKIFPSSNGDKSNPFLFDPSDTGKRKYQYKSRQKNKNIKLDLDPQPFKSYTRLDKKFDQVRNNTDTCAIEESSESESEETVPEKKKYLNLQSCPLCNMKFPDNLIEVQ